MNVAPERVQGQTPSSEAYALLKAQLMREHLSATWGLSETGVAGPTGNKYGYAPGHACLAVSGPLERATTLETRSSDRVENMYAFAIAGLELLTQALESQS